MADSHRGTTFTSTDQETDMFRKSHDDELDSWVARAATLMIGLGGALSLMMFSALALAAIG